MESRKLSKNEKLEKDLKTLVSRMKNESTALKKILDQLKTNTNERPQETTGENNSVRK